MRVPLGPPSLPRPQAPCRQSGLARRGVRRDGRPTGTDKPRTPAPRRTHCVAARRATQRSTAHGRRHDAGAAGERRPLRSPDPSLEPEDEALHLHGAQRHLHHRPPAVAELHRPRLRVRQGDRCPRRQRPLRRHQEAGPGGHRRAGDPRGHAVRQPALAGWHADQLLDRLQASAAPQGAQRDRLHGCGRLGPHQEGAPGPPARVRQAGEDPRRYPRHAARSQRCLDRGHQEGAHRGRRGPEAQHPGRRHPRHQL